MQVSSEPSHAVPASGLPTDENRRRDLSFVAWVVRRLLFTLVVLLALSLVIFAVTEVFPGDVVARLYKNPLPEHVKEAVRERLNLDQPALTRYLDWLGGAVTLDLGESVFSQRPISKLVGRASLHSLVLGGIASLLIVPISIVVGSYAAVRRGKWSDKVISGIALAGLSIPEFVMGSLLVWLFAVAVPIFPAVYISSPEASLVERTQSIVLPILTLMPITGAYMIRTMRASMSRVLSEDFVVMGPIKGLSSRRVILRHALPNSLVPMVNVFALNIGWLIGGMVIVEILFQYPGIGRLLLDGIRSLDVPVIQGAALVIGTAFIVLNFVADVAVFLLDPRIRRSAT